MSSNKTSKWSSSSSLSKILSRISRTLSFSSKKSSQQTLKNNSKKIKPIESSVIKNVNFIPQSAPIIRRHPSQPISKVLYIENSKKEIHSKPMVYIDSDIEEDDNDYSLQPNLSLFNISVENLNSLESYHQHHLLDEVFHSTKIEEY